MTLLDRLKAGARTLLVERYGAHSGRVARVILVSTVLSFLSFPIAVAWMLPK